MKKLTGILSKNFSWKIVLTLFLILFKSSVSNSAQDTVKLEAISDNTLYESATGTVSNGQGKYIFSGKGNTGLIRRGVIRFLTVEFIPPCSKILSVSLKMHLAGGNPANKTIQLRRLSGYWGEGSSDAPGLEENGTTATLYDASWIHKYYNTDFWTNPGGDFSATASGSTVVGGPGYYVFNSTPAMVQDVQDWTDNNSTAFGWLFLGDESASSTAKRFHSTEADTLSFVPELTVIYKTPNFNLYLETLIEGFWDGSSMVDDTVKVKLRNSTFPYAVADSGAEVSGTYGASYCFFNAAPGDYYIAVNHRNSIETWSKSPENFVLNGFNFYDFTDIDTKAYGDNEINKFTRYCIYSGDVNQDGTIDASDLSLVENDAGISLSGYVNTDLTGDDFVDVGDISIVENNLGVNSITP